VGKKLFTLSLFVAGSGCVVASLPRLEFQVERSTVELKGWFSAKGEWILFPLANFKKYSPFELAESQKCVSLINDTGSTSRDYRALEGTEVVVTGVTINYESLSNGTTDSDRLLSKKYYKNQLVENYCLRELVFVVRKIQPSTK
jgi:hypothetical protein